MIQSLDRGIAIMEYLSRRKSAGVTEIAREFGVNKSTASRILLTLMEHDMVFKDPETQKFRLSLGPLLFSYHVTKNHAIMDIAHPILAALCERTGETAHLCALQGNRLYLIDQVKSEKNRYMKDAALPGMIEPFHCSAAGKALLAFMPPSDARRLVEQTALNEYTKNTIVHTDTLMEELALVRERGYALDNEEFSDRVACVAMPVYGEYGCAAHAVGVSGASASLLNENDFDGVLAALRDASRKLTEKSLKAFRQPSAPPSDAEE